MKTDRINQIGLIRLLHGCVSAISNTANYMVARTLDDFRMARARHRSCRCPTEKDAPLSFTWMSSPPIDSTSPFIWQFSRTSHILRSVVVLKGSRFSLSCIFTIKILNVEHYFLFIP